MPEPNSEDVQGSSSFICSVASANGDDIGSDDFVRDDEAESQEQVCGVTPQDPPSTALGGGSQETGKGCIGEVVPRGPPSAGLGGGLRSPGMIEMLMARVCSTETALAAVLHPRPEIQGHTTVL